MTSPVSDPEFGGGCRADLGRRPLDVALRQRAIGFRHPLTIDRRSAGGRLLEGESVIPSWMLRLALPAASAPSQTCLKLFADQSQQYTHIYDITHVLASHINPLLRSIPPALQPTKVYSYPCS